jgi:hypothetical protein
VTLTDTEAPAETLIEEDLLQPSEIVPQASKPEPKVYRCELCPKEYTHGPDHLRRVNLANHVRHQHKTTAPVKAKLPRSAAAVKTVPASSERKRKPAGENLALLVGGASQFAVRSGALPLGNCLAFEAAAAGQAIDVAIAGTWPDKHLVQPLVGGLEKWEAVGACLSLPVTVHLVSVYPGLAVPLADPMRRAAEEILILSVPTIRKKVERDKKLTEALSELGALDANIASDPDPVGSILNGFFAGVPTEAPSDAAEV